MKYDEYVAYLEEIRKTTEYQERRRQLWEAPPSKAYYFEDEVDTTDTD